MPPLEIEFETRGDMDDDSPLGKETILGKVSDILSNGSRRKKRRLDETVSVEVQVTTQTDQTVEEYHSRNSADMLEDHKRWIATVQGRQKHASLERNYRATGM